MELKPRTKVDEFYEIIGATVIIRLFESSEISGELSLKATDRYVGRLEAFVQKEDHFIFKLAGLPAFRVDTKTVHFEMHQRINN